MIIVPVKEGENIEKALKKFKRKFEKTGVIKDTQMTIVSDASCSKKNQKIRLSVQDGRNINSGMVGEVLC